MAGLREKGLSTVVVAAAIAVFMTQGRTTPSTTASPPKTPESPRHGALSQPAVASFDEEPDFREPIRLYREFFGLPPKKTEGATLEVIRKRAGDEKGDRASEVVIQEPLPAEDDSRNFAALKRAAESSGYQMEFLIALVPDPLDSGVPEQFDEDLDGIETAFAAETEFKTRSQRYLLDRFWLPWSGAEAQDHTYRRVPGVLLFRSKGDKLRLLSVLLVGETPKQGIHQAAFAAALNLIDRLRSDCDPVRILGPSFSGTAESLRLAIAKVPANLPPGLGCGAQPARFTIVSGSASAEYLNTPEILGPRERIAFCRVVPSDKTLLTTSLGFLGNELGWNRSEMILLTEEDTAYGQGVETSDNSTWPSHTFRFPAGIADVRTAEEAAPQVQVSPPDGGPFRVPKLVLDLSLAEETKAVDVVHEMSGLSARNDELAIANVLATIARDEIRYVGILATDARDALYLARRIRLVCPNVILFVLGSKLLQVHPQYTEDLNGAIVIASSPLVTETQHSQRWLGGTREPVFRQFVSESQKGVFLATQRLISDNNAAIQPQVWVSAVGNGSFWPLFHGVVDGDRATCTTQQVPLKETKGRPNVPLGEPGRPDFGLLGLAGILLSAGYALRRASSSTEFEAQNLFAAGIAVLWITGFMALTVGTLQVSGDIPRVATQAGFGAIFSLLLWSVTRTPAAWRRSWSVRPPGKPWWRAVALSGYRFARGYWRRVLRVLATGAFLAVIFAWLLERFWMPGGRLLFHLRGRTLVSGLSPLVPMTLLAAAFFVWIFFEIKRRALATRRTIPWTLGEVRLDPALVACQSLVDRIDSLIAPSPPPVPSGLFVGLGLALLLPSLFLFQRIQPICETRPFGWIFLALLMTGVILNVTVLHRFLMLWSAIERLLQRLENTRMHDALRRVSRRVDWKPLRSLGFHVANNDLLSLSIARLGQLENRRLVAAGSTLQAEGLFATLFAEQTAGHVSAEVRARKDIEAFFAEISKSFNGRSDQRIDDFLAIRLVAYLKPTFAHLRLCLWVVFTSGLLLFAAIRSYTFEPQRLISLGMLLSIVAVSALAFWVVAQVDRNALLSAVADTAAGQVTFDRHLLWNVVLYGAIPLAGVILSQFPAVGHLFASWLNPILAAVNKS